MKARILLLGKDPDSLHKLSSNLQQFNQELIQVVSEVKAIELLQQKLRDLIIIDTSFSLEERKKLLVKINGINKNAAFHLVNRQEQYAIRDMVSFVKDGIHELEMDVVGK
jgi:two-component SAPR family response regulator